MVATMGSLKPSGIMIERDRQEVLTLILGLSEVEHRSGDGTGSEGAVEILDNLLARSCSIFWKSSA